MTNFFAVFREGEDLPHIYEVVGNEMQLIDRRSHKASVNGGDQVAIVETLERQLISKPNAPLRVERIEISLGTYHPSIGRPLYPDTRNLLVPNSDDEIAHAKSVWRELDLVSKDLEQCFNVNSLDERNYHSYGIQYERIILFCCIGIESLFRKIYVANGVGRARLTMNDYVKLKVHLRLSGYGLSLVRYPWISNIFPFAGWESERPSESLPWLSAYNSLKHDKKSNEHLASMKNALWAFAGYYTVAYAALAKNLFPGFLSTDYYFHIDERPKWDVGEFYFKTDDEVWRPLALTLD